jgi:hypothetical protein
LLGGYKPKTGCERLRDIIGGSIAAGRSRTEFFTAPKQAGVEIKSGKQLSSRPRGAKKFFRQDTLGRDYSSSAISERLAGGRAAQAKPKIAGTPKSACAPKSFIVNERNAAGPRRWAQAARGNHEPQRDGQEVDFPQIKRRRAV